MATIEKRAHGAWRGRVRRRGYPEQSKSFHNKVAATAWARKIESEMDNGLLITDRESEVMTLGTLLNRYRLEITPHKKSADSESYRLKALLRHKIAVLSMRQLHSHVIASYRDERLKTVSAGTVLKELSLLCHVIDIAMTEWSISLHSNPVKAIRRPPKPKARARRFHVDEEQRLMAQLAEHSCNKLAYSVVVIAIETAMRRSEILRLDWADVDLGSRTVQLPDSKNGLSRIVPLSIKATKVFTDLRINSGNSGPVFLLTANAVKKSFARAVEGAMLDDFRFHDLRHESVSRLFEKGLNIMEVATITGHRDLSSLQRYTHLRAVDLVEKLG